MKVENTYQNQSNVGFDGIHGMGYIPVDKETNDSFTIKPDMGIIGGDFDAIKPIKKPLPDNFGITDVTPLLPEAKPLPRPEIKPIKPQPKPAKPKPQPEIKPIKPQPKPAKPKPQPAKPGNGKIRLK